MSGGADVIVVGGGIVGCACAYELAKHGATVTLLEYGKTGMQATNAAAGMLAPLGEAHGPGPMLDFGARALRGYPRLAEELEAAAGFSVELRIDGILRVAFTDEQADALERHARWQREMGFDATPLDGSACREIEPRLSERVAGGVFSPSEGSVSNQLVALALERAAVAHGAHIVQRAPVTRFLRAGGRISGVIAGGDRYQAATVVLAAGARSGQLAAKAGVALPVFPVRGQMIALGGMRAPIAHPVWGPDGYLVPRANGLVFAGSTVERVGFRRRTTRDGLRRIRATAAALVPQLGAAQVRFEWAGLRPGSEDGLPIIGPVPGADGLVAATGHFRNGILLGPLTGALVADGIVSGRWDAALAAFAPTRFARGVPGEAGATSTARMPAPR
ncbi:MAG TPA: glycine oxidase ThiO [Dehalococcoidia bacterium]|nr:glycine oxidase ThiO [Dehalococcoidia bacterium]